MIQTRFRRVLLLPFPIALAIAAACGDDADPPGATPDGGVDAGSDVVNVTPTDAGSNVVCPASPPDEATGIFVASSGVSTPECGSRTEPCQSITLGMSRAAVQSKAKLYVARGVYGEALSLRAGLRIEGGYDVKADGSWNRACVEAPDAVVIRATGTSSATITAKDLGGKAELAYLRIESKAQTDVKPGESLYGIVATGASTALELTEVRVAMIAAGDGAQGIAGDAGANGPGAGQCDAGNGADGTRGALGDGAQAGTFDPSGYLPAAGDVGGVGAVGRGGNVGGDGQCVQCGSCSAFPDCTFTPAPLPSCGKEGGSGCGGLGGIGGRAGSGGGSSVGIFAWDAKVALVGGTVRAGDGGKGGAGGQGGQGGNGTNGVVGQPTGVCITSCTPNVPELACTTTTASGAGGTTGGPGGGGGRGGSGGGGAGGNSFAIFSGGSAVVSTTNTILEHGVPGIGGGPDGGVGATGAAAVRVP